MYPQCVLALLALYVGLAHCFSWDIVLGGRNGLIFFNNGTFAHSEDIPSAEIMQISYDPVHNRVLFSDYNNASVISSFDIVTKKIKTLLSCKSHGYGFLFAYDPVTETLFRIANSNIYSFSLKSESNNAVEGNFLIKVDRLFATIVVDSCGRYIYWMTDSNIERARFDGSEREVLINNSGSSRAGLAIDQQPQKMYWIDECFETDRFQRYLQSADLNGKNRKTLYSERTFDSGGTITVSKDFIYWRVMSVKKVWQLPKNTPRDRTEPKIFFITNTTSCDDCSTNSMAVNYKLEDQTQGTRSCEALTSVLPSNLSNVSSDVSWLCVHGTKVIGKSACKCTQGYTGERCDVSVCQNYCFQGDCYVNDEQPKCRCNTGYSGERCEVYACHEYCLNNGVCSLNRKSKPVCQCTADFEGERCDDSVCQNYCIQGHCNVSAEGQPKCRCYVGYAGERCEISVCHGYCLNNGNCSLNKDSVRVCQCTEYYKGERCDVTVGQESCNLSAQGDPKCRCDAGYSTKRYEANVCQGHCLNNGVCSLNEGREPVCQCTGDYEGERCDISACQNYCFQGNCSTSADGLAKCRCDAGYSGERCEINACQGYCLNSGVCSMNMDSEPVCQCTDDYEGERCDASVPAFLMKCFQMVSKLSTSRGILKPDVQSSQSYSRQRSATTVV